MQDPFDDASMTPRTFDTPLRPQHDRETYRATGKRTRRDCQWKLGDQLGTFSLERLLGQGSSGYVFEAFERTRQWRCALKILVPETTEDLVRNKMGFRRMIGIRHPNLTLVDQIHRFDETFALSMELIQGQTFAKAIHELRRLETYVAYERILDLLRHYARALSVMHANYLIHRDIKPQNMMVDVTGRGKIIDYGLVGTVDPEIDPKGIRPYLAGTPQYMAPEVWYDQCYIPAGDVYSLGKVIFETLMLISGSQRVFASNRDAYEESQKMQASMSELDPLIPNLLRDACAEMLEPAPGDRPTASEISRLGQSSLSTFIMPSDRQIYGREDDLGRIWEWLDAVLKGKSGRLHLSGPSGIGKSRIVDEILRKLSTLRWVHVFNAKCHVRDDQPMQSFDQITDALATRYAKEDLGELEIDPGSAAILHQGFPVLRSVVKASRHLPLPGSVPARLDALEAAVRLAHKILETGPMLLIFDDAHWMDQDSINVLDRFQSERAKSFGIITVSRNDDDLQRIPADLHLRLGPISIEDSTKMLRNAAHRWSVPVPDETLRALAEVTAGHPFRLDELAEEFRPEGAFAKGDVIPTHLPFREVIDGLWRNRYARCSESAKELLRMIATVGGTISICELTHLQDDGRIDSVAIDELRQQRLVEQESSKASDVRIIHDRVTSGIIESLSPEERRATHRIWADTLLASSAIQYPAARIAGHLFEASDINNAIPYAEQAVQDAQVRYAFTEAARWHERIIPYVKGDELIDRLRKTAKAFDVADRPVEAAHYYQQLAALVDNNERTDCEIRSLVLLTRSGQTSEIRQSMLTVAQRLGLPKPKSSLKSQLAVICSIGLLQWKRMLRKVRPTEATSDTECRKIQLCLALSRPLSILDNRYGAELGIAGALLAMDHGDECQRLKVGVGEAVYCSYNENRLRHHSERVLSDLLNRALQLGDLKTIGDCYSGIGATHFLAGRWNAVLDPCEMALQAYRHCDEHQSFEIAHTQFMMINAFWHLGRIQELRHVSYSMRDQSVARNDSLGLVLGCSGFGCIPWLTEHRLSEFETSRLDSARVLKFNHHQFVDFLEATASMLRLMYEGRWEDAAHEFGRNRNFKRSWMFREVQACRVQRDSILGLVLLNLLAREPSFYLRKWARKIIRRLREERMSSALVTADLYEGYLRVLESSAADAIHMFTEAERRAKELGMQPYLLAAGDALETVHTGNCSNRLEQHLRNEGVMYADKLSTLYALRLPSRHPSSYRSR